MSRRYCPWCDDHASTHSDRDCPDFPADRDRSAEADLRDQLVGTVQQMVHHYVALVEALPPQQGADGMGRSPTKVHAPSPVNEATVDERSRLRVAIRQGMRLREEAASLLFRIRAYAHAAESYDELRMAFVLGPCPKPGCGDSDEDGYGGESLELVDMKELRCTSGDPAHTIPRALWPRYEERLFG